MLLIFTEKGTRTPILLKGLEPKPNVSTNFTISAERTLFVNNKKYNLCKSPDDNNIKSKLHYL